VAVTGVAGPAHAEAENTIATPRIELR